MGQILWFITSKWRYNFVNPYTHSWWHSPRGNTITPLPLHKAKIEVPWRSITSMSLLIHKEISRESVSESHEVMVAHLEAQE